MGVNQRFAGKQKEHEFKLDENKTEHSKNKFQHDEMVLKQGNQLTPNLYLHVPAKK